MHPNGERNWRFDFLKGISCIFVVFLHCHFPGTMGDIIIYACRFPVPLFFMISGYYSYAKESIWIKRRAVGILKMLLLTELTYGLLNCLCTFLSGESSVIDYLKGLSVFTYPIRVLLCGSFFNGTLWYLYAIFWTYCILYIFSRKENIKNLQYLLIPILLGLQILGRFYWQNHFNIQSDIYLFRNVFLFGLPLTMYGSLLAKLEKSIKQKINWQRSILIFILGVVLMTGEYFLSGQYMDFHFSTLFTSTGLFLLAMTYPFAEPKLLKYISFIGHRLSMLIYLSHIGFSSIIQLIALKCGMESDPIFLWVYPFLVCVCSGLFALIVNCVQKRKLKLPASFRSVIKTKT